MWFLCGFYVVFMWFLCGLLRFYSDLMGFDGISMVISWDLMGNLWDLLVIFWGHKTLKHQGFWLVFNYSINDMEI